MKSCLMTGLLIAAAVCASPAADGGECGLRAQGRQCLAPAVCVEGTCRLPGSTMCP